MLWGWFKELGDRPRTPSPTSGTMALPSFWGKSSRTFSEVLFKNLRYILIYNIIFASGIQHRDSESL